MIMRKRYYAEKLTEFEPQERKKIKGTYIYELYDTSKLVGRGSLKELSDLTGISPRNLHTGTFGRRVIHVATICTKYQLFKDGELLKECSFKELQEFLYYKTSSIRSMIRTGDTKNGYSIIQADDFIEVPVPGYEITNQPQKKIVKSKPEKWKPNPHSKMLFDYCFKNWGVKS